ncbi:RDD family protein [Oceanobacillus piezotolerans]|uniref:RDD family protein n=1 Tax=Oceanobacillus piezotolerans TaxID=2448030 RepID=A0A498DDX7_9BACI|nr:RDD family protein [Oceanobacillus piezotolerans]RLL48276.1 RDD family protein [Oceanobacillus piezotolerans]
MYASFINRFKAFMIDYLLILAYLMIVLIINIFLFPSLQDLFKQSPILAELSGFLMVTLPISLYFIISDSNRIGQSFGKKTTGIKVIEKNGESPSIIRLTYRTIIKFLPWELSHFLVYRLIYIGDGEVPLIYFVIGGVIYVLILVYILSAVFSKKKQSVYDKLVGMYVVKV